MAEVLSLAGQKLESRDLAQRSQDVICQLRQLIADVEAGKFMLDEEWLLIYQKASQTTAGNVSSHSIDSGLTLAEAVNLMEQHKFDLMIMAREAAR